MTLQHESTIASLNEEVGKLKEFIQSDKTYEQDIKILQGDVVSSVEEENERLRQLVNVLEGNISLIFAGKEPK